jgi:NAD-dependent DNA ligase
MDEKFYNQVGVERISDRQIDELIGLAKGIVADGAINHLEVEFLQKWLAANLHITNHPMVRALYQRVDEILSDGIVDIDEKNELLDTLNSLSARDFELGESLKATTLPLCNPQPALTFPGQRYTFTGTFNFGKRNTCEKAVIELGAETGPITMKTKFLVIGTYATDSWKHSSFGNKILKACGYRDKGVPISIVSEEHWTGYL